MPIKKLITRGFQRYWRVTRALTIGAQGCVLDSEDRVLLVRHTYREGWHFPGGGVEPGESVELALSRELKEEAGIIIEARPQVFGIYDHRLVFPGDHIVLFVVRSWRQPSVPPPNREIAEQGFFKFNELPAGVSAPTLRRLQEVLGAGMPAEMW